ncbi:hypothetical protein DL1_17900 [Thioclava dalianensis]|uniref:Translocase n=2 Tax=Thioclava dalianensis TaxID=1185766 RepID=A0A074TNB4_9RHOB|nr:hypothetical protein [Thioclava dalianensis]KEP70483.1 hypothetical protein DL1_17900 [Thioclava dalianensis]SFN31422.1 hypothetical protein SAMN05216224_10468 [Thioclava dalianensis]
MRRMHKLTLIGATFFLAAATGHVMQSVTPSPEQAGLSPARDVGMASTAKPTPPKTPRTQLASMTVLRNPTSKVIAQDTGVEMIPQMPDESQHSFTALSTSQCPDATLHLDVTPAGSVSAALSASCAGGANIKVSDGILTLTAMADQDGNWQALLPALTARTEVSVQFQQAQIATQTIDTPSATKLDRVILTADSASSMHLDIHEMAPGEEGSGDISAEMPRNPDDTIGGYLMSYAGPEGSQIELYTAPSSVTQARLQIEAEVTPDNCGTTATGTLQRFDAGVPGPTQPVSIDMPSCEAVGQSVVLPLPDLHAEALQRIAQK